MALLAIVAGLVALTGWALESGGVAALETQAADGSRRSTHVWFVASKGKLWVRLVPAGA